MTCEGQIMSHCLQPKLMLDRDYAAFEAGSLRELDFTWTWPSTAPPLTLGVITSFCGLPCQSVLLQSYPPSPQKAWRLQTPTPLYRGLGVRAVRPRGPAGSLRCQRPRVCGLFYNIRSGKSIYELYSISASFQKVFLSPY